MQVLSLECFKHKCINLVFLLFFFRNMVVFSKADGAETGSLQLQSEKKKKTRHKIALIFTRVWFKRIFLN